MENNAMYIPLWIQIIIAVSSFGALVLLATWSIVWEWIKEHSKALRKKISSAVVFAATNNTAKLGSFINRHHHIRPRHA